MLRLLKASFARPDVSPDGFGQSAADDLRYLGRFRRCRKQPVTWREPTADEVAAQDAHPLLGRFGEFPVLVAEVDGRRWSVRERAWFGWPDPERYAFFVLEGEEVWAAADFNDWPRAWTPKPD